jgi:hypothetical protein
MVMGSFRRKVTGTIALGVLAVGLAGCGSFDPTDAFNFLDRKKPIPGERHAVFPEGVPGVPQGIPQDLVKGHQAPPTDTAALSGEATTASAAAAPGGGGTPEPKTAAKPKPKPRVAARPKPRKSKATPVQPAESEPASRITVAPSKPANQTASQPPAQPAAQPAAPSAVDNSSVWGPVPGQASTGTTTSTNSGAAAPWPSTKPVPNSPWPDAPNPNQFSR